MKSQFLAHAFFADADAASAWDGSLVMMGDALGKKKQSRRFRGHDHHLVSSEKLLCLSMCPRPRALTGRVRLYDGGSEASAEGVVSVLVPSAASLPEPAIAMLVGPAFRT